MIINIPIIVINPVNKFVNPNNKPSDIVSTSWINRDKISPLEWTSKYERGIFWIYLNVDLRKSREILKLMRELIIPNSQDDNAITILIIIINNNFGYILSQNTLFWPKALLITSLITIGK